MTILAFLQSANVFPGLLALAGFVFLGDGWLSGREGGIDTAARFLMNVISLPLGAATAVAAGLDVYTAGHFALATGIGLVVGLALAGRSLIELPWTGAVSLVAAAAVGWYLDRGALGALSLDTVLIASGVTFLIVYAILRFIELPMRLAATVTNWGPFLYLLGIAAWVGAGVAILFGVG